jgi:hypothetical protein
MNSFMKLIAVISHYYEAIKSYRPSCRLIQNRLVLQTRQRFLQPNGMNDFMDLSNVSSTVCYSSAGILSVNFDL